MRSGLFEMGTGVLATSAFWATSWFELLRVVDEKRITLGVGCSFASLAADIVEVSLGSGVLSLVSGVAISRGTAGSGITCAWFCWLKLGFLLFDVTAVAAPISSHSEGDRLGTHVGLVIWPLRAL